MKLHWTRQAFADLQSAYDSIAEDNPDAAAAVMARIEQAIEALRKFPEIGRVGRVPGTRELFVTSTPFLLAYAVVKDEIHLQAVLHGSRKWMERF